MVNALNFFVGHTNNVNYKLRPYVMAGISLYAIFRGDGLSLLFGVLLALLTVYIFRMRR